MRHLGIDFGEKRVGLSISDEEARFSLPLQTLQRASDSQVIAEIATLVAEQEVRVLVLGEPRGLDGRAGDAARRVRSFATKLQAAIGLPVHLVDEALTTAEAESRLREAGLSPRKMWKRKDALAAQILLQDWLDRSSRG